MGREFERFDGDVLAPSSRRTARLDHIVHHLGLAKGGRPAATLAKRLMLPVSNDTLLRIVRRRGSPRFVPPSVIGIDDWAWRRNQRYGTIICDLGRRKNHCSLVRSGAFDGEAQAAAGLAVYDRTV